MRRGHMTWRVEPEGEHHDVSLDRSLQALEFLAHVPKPHYRWVTVARGNPEVLQDIAEALNRARFTLFDLRPAKEMLHVRDNDGTVGDGRKRNRRSGRKLPGRKVAS